MFRPSRTQQSLLEAQWLLPPEKRDRLQRSWAQPFRTDILPLIDEEPFRPFFHENNGQPNKSIRLLVGVHLLKERFDLTDEQVIENLEFSLIWQHALGVEPGEAHACQKTLHNFRTLVVKEKLGDALFVETTKEIAKAAGISFARQRQDSTHVVSNMATLSRLGILVETTATFLNELKRQQRERFEALPASYAKRYLDREGYFADAKKEQARRRLPIAAQDLFRLVQRFESDELVAGLPSFAMMRRVLNEQCRVLEKPAADAIAREEEACEPTCATAEHALETAREGQPTADEHAAKPAPAAKEREVAPTVKQQDATETPCARSPEAAHAPTASAVATEEATPPIGEDAVAPVVSTGKVLESPRAPAAQAAPCAPTLEAAGAEPDATAAPDAPAQSEAESAAALRAADAVGVQGESNLTGVMLLEPKEISSASLQSPHDPDATYGHKGKGYEIQIAETCVEGNPFQLITSVSVNGAHESDQHALVPTIDALAKNGMAPDALIADTGYGSGENIVAAAQRGTQLIAPVRDPRDDGSKGKSDERWETPAEPPKHEQPPTSSSQPSSASAARPVGPGQEQSEAKLTLADFEFSQDFRVLMSCPAGNEPSEQLFAQGQVKARFSPSACEGCPLADRCPGLRLVSGGRRLWCTSAEAATAHRQREQRTDEFKRAYRIRSGIESTNSQLKGAQGADALRVRGRARIEFVMTFKALALNVFRYVRHVVDELDQVDPDGAQLVTAGA